MIDIHGNCPKCNVSWDDGDIPEKDRKHYSEPYKWSRVIGVTVRGQGDITNYWKCPDCNEEFIR